MSGYFGLLVVLGAMRVLARVLMRAAAGVLLALLLAGAGVQPQPAPGPVPSQAQACTESTAAFVRRANVERTEISNGAQIQVPIGYAVAWSCASAADADAELQRRIAEILQ